VKIMTSHRIFLGMHPPPLNSAHLGRAVDRDLYLLIFYIISMLAVTGKNFSPIEIIS
jgi:hypothetical protein